jgi:hypothetical protein
MTCRSDTLVERFWAKVDRSDNSSCWVWTGCVLRNGYGQIVVEDNKKDYAHRVAYEIEYGPITPGLVIDHLCENRRCVNPGHLAMVTHRQNILRGSAQSALNHRKTTCVNGHPLVVVGSQRRCRICKNANARARRAETTTHATS